LGDPRLKSSMLNFRRSIIKDISARFKSTRVISEIHPIASLKSICPINIEIYSKLILIFKPIII